MKLSELLGVLPKLSLEELATVRATIEHLLGQRQAATPTAPKPEIALYEAARAIVGGPMAYGPFANSVAGRAWAKNAPSAVAFIDTFPTDRRVSRNALDTFMLGLIVDDLKAKRIPVSMGTIANNLGRLKQLFDQGYPGYIESGMQHVVLKALKINEPKEK